MDKIDLSIVLPTIRVQNLPAVYNSIVQSIGKYTFELICVGPLLPPEELCGLANFKFVKDWGSPARCAQIGFTLAEGEIVTWGSDDGLYQPNALEECVKFLYDRKNPIDDWIHEAIIVRYCEGINRQGTMPDDSYWKAHTHADQRLPGIPVDFYCCPVGMYYRRRLLDLGGIDCKYEHVNMNAHDLAFRHQRNNGYFTLSPSLVISCEFENATDFHRPLDHAYITNDGPRFREKYIQDQTNWKTKIPLDNWQQSDRIWKRRFQVQ